MSQGFTPRTRWARWEQAVLARTRSPAEAQQIMIERQIAVDDDTETRDLVVAKLHDYMESLGLDPNIDHAFISSASMARIVNEATGERMATSRASALIGTLGIPELSKTKRRGRPGWRWAVGPQPEYGRRPVPELVLPRAPESEPPPEIESIDRTAEVEGGAAPPSSSA